MKPIRPVRRSILALILAAVFLSGAAVRLLAVCGPFTDSDGIFCPFILQMYYMGITAGTSPTTFSPNDPVTRGQMAVFIGTGVNQTLARGSRRAALNQWWTTTPQYDSNLGLTTVGSFPRLLQSDGADIWVPNFGPNTVSRVRSSDGKPLETWTAATNATAALSALGRVFVTSNTNPGQLYMIDPSQAAGAVTLVASNLGNSPFGIAFDGARIWTANTGGSVSIVTPAAAPPWPVTNVSAGFSLPEGMVFDGSNIWVTDNGDNKLKKLNASGGILTSVTVGTSPVFPAFDGTNIWVPNFVSHTVTVVRAVGGSSGTVLQTLSGNGLSQPYSAAFDGQRILVANNTGGLSLFKAADLSPMGSFPTTGANNPYGVCSDGVNFWVSFNGSASIGRF